jgi:hypothetical protein
MVWSKKLKPLSIIFAAVLAIGLAAYVLWHPARVVDDPIARLDPPPSAGQPDDPQPEGAETSPPEPHTTLLSAQPRGAVAAAEQRKRAVTQVTIPPDVVMDDYKAELWAEIQADPPEFRQPGDPALDADTAYRLYMYFGNCSVVLSRAQHFDQQLEKIANRAETAHGRYLEDLEGRLDEIIDYMDLCQPIPADVDARLQAVIWMSEAVRLGHEIAEVQFYQKAMGFLMRPDPSNNKPPLAMKYPGLVEDFKTTARLGLARALEKGHPEAYLAKSQAVLEGLIYPRDPLLAYAYARKAELEAAKHHMIVKDIALWKEQAAQYLSQEQVKEAGQMALELKAPWNP